VRPSAAGDPRDWDADSYDALPLPHEGWGRRTLARLPLVGDETVLELGCGTGRDTARLLDRLPRGRVVAVDASAAMLERTRRRCAHQPPGRLALVRLDLRRPLPLPTAAVDAAFSVATLHWLPDHGSVFAELGRVIRPGGRLALDYGGAGNIATVDAALADLGRANAPWMFQPPNEEVRRLRAAGFSSVAVSLRPDPVRLPADLLPRYLETVVLGGQLAELPPAARPAFVAAVAARLPAPVLDYVRMEVSAVRSGGGRG
jgi:trans-aconitate 2-methyltransferase